MADASGWPLDLAGAPPTHARTGYRERHWERAREIEFEHKRRGTNGLPALARLLAAVETAEQSRGCAKRGCCAVNPPWEQFGTRDGKTWCLGHIPLRARLRVWWQEQRA
jgi:hypothetical protein